MYVNFKYATPFDLPPTSPIATDLVSSPRAGKFTILHSALLRPAPESKHAPLNPLSQVHFRAEFYSWKKLGPHHSYNILNSPSAVPRHWRQGERKRGDTRPGNSAMDWKIFCRPFEKIARSFRTKAAKRNREKQQREKRRKVGFWYGDKGWSGNIVESGDTIH
jgi:hypothetical protein